MKKTLFVLLIGLFLISLISAYDQGLPENICGGDSELIIGCLGDQELIFIGGLAPTTTGGLSIGTSPESANISSKTPTILIPKEEKEKQLLPYVLLLIFSFGFLILIYKKRKEKAKKEKDKNLNSLDT